ncbi:hypothetical protein IQ238_14765 [Pleurocapsales cyanobacterium LEGE 06147]|nr:hypothetical protein [Pleurocapsales cyanobacterium LEGE 06147]
MKSWRDPAKRVLPHHAVPRLWRDCLSLVKIRRISPIVIAAGVWFAATPVAFTQEEILHQSCTR